MGIFQDVIAARHLIQRTAGPHFVPPLDSRESALVHDWIRQERSAAQPDSDNWRRFWTGSKPFFADPLSRMLDGRVVPNIHDCADESDPDALQVYPRLDPGWRFVVAGIDCTRIEVYDAEHAVFIDRAEPRLGWRLGPRFDADGNDIGLLWQPYDYTDLLHILLFTWREDCIKSNRARERLCDIAEKVMSLPAAP